MKYKLFKLLEVYGEIEKVLKNSTDFKLNMQLMENQDLIEPHKNRLSRLIGENPEYLQYEKERITLCNQYCDKDNEGNSLVIDGAFIGLNVNVEFQNKVEALNDHYKNTIEEMSPKITEYNKVLYTTDIDIEFLPITEDVSNGVMTGMTQKILRPLFQSKPKDIKATKDPIISDENK